AGVRGAVAVVPTGPRGPTCGGARHRGLLIASYAVGSPHHGTVRVPSSGSVRTGVRCPGRPPTQRDVKQFRRSRVRTVAGGELPAPDDEEPRWHPTRRRTRPRSDGASVSTATRSRTPSS